MSIDTRLAKNGSNSAVSSKTIEKFPFPCDPTMLLSPLKARPLDIIPLKAASTIVNIIARQ